MCCQCTTCARKRIFQHSSFQPCCVLLLCFSPPPSPSQGMCVLILACCDVTAHSIDLQAHAETCLPSPRRCCTSTCILHRRLKCLAPRTGLTSAKSRVRHWSMWPAHVRTTRPVCASITAVCSLGSIAFRQVYFTSTSCSRWDRLAASCASTVRRLCRCHV